MKVYKYVIKPGDRATIEMPKGAQILSVHDQGTDIFVWALVDPEERQMEEREFLIVATGQDRDDIKNAKFIGTVLFAQFNFSLVFHVFEEVRGE